MRAVREMLANAGFDMEHYHQESFSAPIIEEVVVPLIEGEAAADSLPLRFAVSDVDAQCLPGQTVLQAARASGVRISAACEFGLCGTCKVRKVSGTVAMNHNGGILDDEIEEGFILACCSRPVTAVEIEA